MLARVQEFARIIFVDNILNYAKKIEYHRPLLIRPPYESLMHLIFGPKIVRQNPNFLLCFNYMSISLQKLNDPFQNCLTPNCNCIAALQQKNLSNSVGNNLRNVKPIKTIPLHFKMDAVQKRPYEFLGTLIFHNFKTSLYNLKSFSDVLSVAKVAIINRIANTPSSVPGLVQDDSNVRYCNSNDLPEKYDIDKDNKTIYHCTHLIPLELDEIYEFLLIDDTTDEFVSHPIHMHGYGFQVIDMGSLKQLETGETPFAKATHPPVIKDTVTIPKHGFVRIRFRTSNPGYWMLHCHIGNKFPTLLLFESFFIFFIYA